ncbi:hypothetical protein SAMD00023353_1700660 [Rosellinia necatrix]|uniref:Uncharacterized protein n=1 Tax=Rosellinia necatrix TaxID=77044 RepID=A0A1S8A7G9_ROSNE|nr:hypothetical protein SAMD00023353_1700660 [Rosellinia necatrix]
MRDKCLALRGTYDQSNGRIARPSPHARVARTAIRTERLGPATSSAEAAEAAEGPASCRQWLVEQADYATRGASQRSKLDPAFSPMRI